MVDIKNRPAPENDPIRPKEKDGCQGVLLQVLGENHRVPEFLQVLRQLERAVGRALSRFDSKPPDRVVCCHAPTPSLCPTPFENDDSQKWTAEKTRLEAGKTRIPVSRFEKFPKSDIILPPRRRQAEMSCSEHGRTSQGRKTKRDVRVSNSWWRCVHFEGGRRWRVWAFKRFRGSKF